MQHSNHQSQSHQNQINLPKNELPKGGGTVRGADSNFHTDAFTGSASFQLPIPLPGGRGLAPNLSVAYSSSSGNGLLGAGFNLQVPSISRKTSRRIPTYDNGGSLREKVGVKIPSFSLNPLLRVAFRRRAKKNNWFTKKCIVSKTKIRTKKTLYKMIIDVSSLGTMTSIF